MNKNEAAAVMLFSAYLRGSQADEAELSGVDSEGLRIISRNHQIDPMIYKTLKGTAFFAALPEFDRKKWKHEALLSVASQMRRDERLWKVYEKISEAGIKALLMKGASLRTVYPDPELRFSSDEDIWIGYADYNECDKLLVREGFKCVRGDESPEVNQDVGYSDKRSDIFIELHLNPVGVEYQTRISLNNQILVFFETTSDYKYENHLFKSLAPTENLIFILCHFMKHFLSQGATIRMVTDILLFMKKYENAIDFVRFDDFLNKNNFYKIQRALIIISRYKLGITPPEYYMNIDNEETNDLLDDIMSGGAVGTFSKEREQSAFIVERAAADITHGKKNVFFSAIFPSPSFLSLKYPVLNKNMWLLPVCWLHRTFSFIFGSSLKSKFQAYRIGNARVRLFEKYGII
jgi:hypothetical protein